MANTANSNSPFSTPKRKRTQLFQDDELPGLDTTSLFTFDPNAPAVQDGSMSPRSRVALKFRGLTLASGGGVTAGGGSARTSSSPEPRFISDAPHDAFSTMHDIDMQDGARKRIKLPDVQMADSDSTSDVHPSAITSAVELGAKKTMPLPLLAAKPANVTPAKTDGDNSNQRRQSPKSVQFAIDIAVVEQSETLASTGTENSADGKAWKSTSPPGSPKQASQGKPRNRKRAGTPPAKGADAEKPEIVNALRASLTWHDDEITIYDPDDSDDDGTGINGIGFKPTPAIAYARTVRRRQQLAEYKKREEREARAKRNQRRRGSPVPGLVELKGSVERRKVRFMESATELIGF